jgi:hypothetical protein
LDRSLLEFVPFQMKLHQLKIAFASCFASVLLLWSLVTVEQEDLNASAIAPLGAEKSKLVAFPQGLNPDSALQPTPTRSADAREKRTASQHPDSNTSLEAVPSRSSPVQDATGLQRPKPAESSSPIASDSRERRTKWSSGSHSAILAKARFAGHVSATRQGDSASKSVPQNHGVSLVSDSRRSVLATHPEPLPPLEPTQSPTNTVEMKLGEVKKLSVGFDLDSTMHITRVQRSDESVCEVFISEGNRVKLAATAVGTTEVEIFFRSRGDSNQKRVQSQRHLVRVNQLSDDQIRRRKIVSLNRAVERLAPEASVTFTLSNRGVLATGECESEDSARRILSLARRVVQAPVVDQLQVRMHPETSGQRHEPKMNYQPTMLRSDGFQDAGEPISHSSILMQ